MKCFGLILVVALLSGCAVGKTADGGIVLGIEAGVLVESAEEGIAAGINWLIPTLGTALGGSGAIAGVLGVVRAASKERARKKADRAREIAERNAAVLAAQNGNGAPVVVPPAV